MTHKPPRDTPEGREYHNRHSRRSKWRRQGMDPDSAEATLAAHQGACGICRTREPGPRGWQVDHDHLTGQVRGILCFDCNTGLGKLGDNLESLKAAIEYLKGK